METIEATSARDVQAAGRRFRVRVAGDGPAVLLLHGLPTSGLLWEGVATRLASRARVIVPDLLGYGYSDRPDGMPVDLASQAAYLIELLNVLGIERATLVGHDIGGGIAQILAVRYPDRVERLGLVNCVAYDNWPVPEAKLLQASAPVVRRMPPEMVAQSILAGLLRGFHHAERGASFLEACLEPFSDPAGLGVLLEHVEALDAGYTRTLAPNLPALDIPAAVVWGEDDPFLNPRYATRLAGDLPRAELTWVAASHFSPVDAPDDVADALLRLLDQPVVPE